MKLNDALVKVDSQLEVSLRKIQKQAEELDEGIEFTLETVEGE